MGTIEEIKSAIESLSKDDYIHLNEWMSERTWTAWDRQVAEDDANGKLDFLIDEAMAEKRKGTLRRL